MNRYLKFFLVSISIMLVLFLLGLGLIRNIKPADATKNKNNTRFEINEKTVSNSNTYLNSKAGSNSNSMAGSISISNTDAVEEKDTVTILATGDIMFHSTQYFQHKNEKGEYDISHFYERMEDFLKKGDIVVGNLETTIDPSKPPKSYPQFNTPEGVLKYLKASGFNVFNTVNNHSYDSYRKGIISTINALNSNGIKHFGTYKDVSRPPLIMEVKGIKVGFIGYSQIYNGFEAQFDKELFSMVSPLRKELILKDIEKLKNAGAEYIISYVHWGIEYQYKPNKEQIDFRDFLLKSGVDAVLGSHPHVLQKAEMSKVEGENKFTIYSMGNSISGQSQSFGMAKGVESGVFVELKLKKENGKVKLKEVNLHPTFVTNLKEKDGKTYYRVALYKDLLEGGKYSPNSKPDTIKFLKDNYEFTKKVLNFNGLKDDSK